VFTFISALSVPLGLLSVKGSKIELNATVFRIKDQEAVI